MMKSRLSLLALPLLLAACAVTVPPPAAPVYKDPVREAPLHQLKPAQIDQYLTLLQAEQPDLRQRVATIARRFLNQPYELYLLGEFPYEIYDSQPLFNIESSDCVVFVEHVYAMALSRNWAEFFWMLQRIRYRDGVIGVTTRNHYTEADWLPANRWLLGADLTDGLLPGAAIPYKMLVDRERFFRDRYKLQVPVAKQAHEDSYLPKTRVAEALAQLQTGDLVNIVTGMNGGAWVSHVGLVVVGADGERRMLHSSAPMVREQSFASYIEAAQQRTERARSANPGKPASELLGFKFLRLNDRPEPPAMAPQPRPTIYPRVPG